MAMMMAGDERAACEESEFALRSMHLELLARLRQVKEGMLGHTYGLQPELKRLRRCTSLAQRRELMRHECGALMALANCGEGGCWRAWQERARRRATNTQVTSRAFNGADSPVAR